MYMYIKYQMGNAKRKKVQCLNPGQLFQAFDMYTSGVYCIEFDNTLLIVRRRIIVQRMKLCIHVYTYMYMYLMLFGIKLCALCFINTYM